MRMSKLKYRLLVPRVLSYPRPYGALRVRENLGTRLKYRKSSIKPPGGLFFSSTLEKGGGGLIEGEGLKERGVCLI